MTFERGNCGMEFFVVIVVCAFVVILIRSITEFINNQNSPELTQAAILRRKRQYTTTDNNGVISTSYAAEFELRENGESIRCYISYRAWKALEENTLGQLTHKGTRFRRFEWNGKSVEK